VGDLDTSDGFNYKSEKSYEISEEMAEDLRKIFANAGRKREQKKLLQNLHEIVSGFEEKEGNILRNYGRYSKKYEEHEPSLQLGVKDMIDARKGNIINK
jgi:hypothetical protein